MALGRDSNQDQMLSKTLHYVKSGELFQIVGDQLCPESSYFFVGGLFFDL